MSDARKTGRVTIANGKYCVVNNTYVPQDTTVYTDSGSLPLHLEANEIRWYNL